VVEHQRLRGVGGDELDDPRQVARVDEDLVDELVPRERAHAAAEVRALEEALVGLVLHDVAQALEPRLAREARELALDLGRAQVRPADDAHHERVRAREAEQELRLGAARAGLHREAALEARAAQLRLEVAGRKSRRMRAMRASIQPYSASL
jgi:hypothetical protein